MTRIETGKATSTSASKTDRVIVRSGDVQPGASYWNQFLHSNLRLGRHRDVRLACWILFALGCGFLAYVARMHEITHDAFHEMSLFREALVQQSFPQEDVFAFTPTVSPSVHHEWATGAILYFATVGSGFGLVGLSVLKLALMAAMWLLLYRVARMRGAHPYVFAAVSFACFPVFWVGFATVRAQLFTLVFIAAQLWMQELDWRGRRAWILLWLVMLVAWLNIHAGFVVGLGMIAFHGCERLLSSWLKSRSLIQAIKDTWHLIVAAPAAVMVLPINPYGWQYIPYLVRAIGMDRPLIREWKPLWHTYAPIWTIALFTISIALIVYVMRNTRIRRLKGSAFLALAAYMTLKHIRHGSIYGVVWLAYVPAWLSRTKLGQNLVHFIETQRVPTIRVCQVLAVGCLSFASVNHFWRPTLTPKQLHSTAFYPTEAVDYLKQNDFRGNLFTPFHVGAYVSWELFPQVKVSFDGRYEVAYQDHVMDENCQFMLGAGNWWEVLDRYPTDAALINKDAPIYDALQVFRESAFEKHPPMKRRWKFVYEDDSYVVIAPASSQLPVVDRRGLSMRDGAWEAFTWEHSHWAARQHDPRIQQGTSRLLALTALPAAKTATTLTPAGDQ